MKRLLIISLAVLLSSFLCQALGEEDFVIAQPGDSGVDVEIVLGKCHELGFIEELSEGKDEYVERYIPGIIQMERTLGLNEDGIIRLSEFEEIETAIGPGSKGDTVGEILERLYEFGLIKKELPKVHTTYEEQYATAVKSMENKLGLCEDGILTKSEQVRLRRESFPELPNVKNVNAKYSKGEVTVSWKAVPGATGYIIYRGLSEAGKVSGEQTSWIDKTLNFGETCYYTVSAFSYLRQSEKSDRKTVKIPEPRSIELRVKNNSYRGTVTSGVYKNEAASLSYSKNANNGKDKDELRVLSFTQQQLYNYCNRFRIVYVAPAGYNISIFNPPNGNKLMLLSERKTSAEPEEIVFDIQDNLLEKISCEISIKFYKQNDDHFFIFPTILKPKK